MVNGSIPSYNPATRGCTIQCQAFKIAKLSMVPHCEINILLLTVNNDLSTISSTFRSKRLYSTHCMVLYSSMLCCAVQSHPGMDRINTSYFAVLSHNPTWQPCSTSDRGSTAHKQIVRNRHGICPTLIRSNRNRKCVYMLIMGARAFTRVYCRRDDGVW